MSFLFCAARKYWRGHFAVTKATGPRNEGFAGASKSLSVESPSFAVQSLSDKLQSLLEVLELVLEELAVPFPIIAAGKGLMSTHTRNFELVPTCRRLDGCVDIQENWDYTQFLQGKTNV